MPITVIDSHGKAVAKVAPVSELDKHIKGTQVHGHVSSQKHSYGKPIEPEHLSEVAVTNNVQLGADETIEVGFGVGRTINLGDFNSVKVSVSIKAPCSKDDIEAAYDWMTDWVGDKLEEAVSAATGKAQG